MTENMRGTKKKDSNHDKLSQRGSTALEFHCGNPSKTQQNKTNKQTNKRSIGIISEVQQL